MQLHALLRSRTVPADVRLRAQIVLLKVQGSDEEMIAARAGVSRRTVRKWWKRFGQDGIDGLYDEPRSGRPRVELDRQIEKTLWQSGGEQDSDWSCRSLARKAGISKSSAQRILRYVSDGGRLEWPGLPAIARLTDRVRDIIAVVLAPPVLAIVLGVLDDPHILWAGTGLASVPADLGYLRGTTGNGVDTSPITLPVALDVANGRLSNHASMTPGEFLMSTVGATIHRVSQISSAVPLDVIVNGQDVCREKVVSKWLGKHEDIGFYCTADSGCWMKQLEMRWTIISQQARCRGSFSSSRLLAGKVEQFLSCHREGTEGFSWIATRESIHAKRTRLLRFRPRPGYSLDPSEDELDDDWLPEDGL